MDRFSSEIYRTLQQTDKPISTQIIYLINRKKN